MLTVSSLRYGTITTVDKQGTGSATLNASGNFTGAIDLQYTVEIDSVAAGAEIGQATFRWSDGSGAWNASGVLTFAVPTLLNNGAYIAFVAGSGDDFVIADDWSFKAINLFSPGKMLTSRRDDRYRSQALESPNTITVVLASAQEVKALAMYDHNFTSAATITLEADAAATFDSGPGATPQFTESITWASDKILHYLSVATTKRYWRLKATDIANPDGYVEISELFLGSYLELTRNRPYGLNWNYDIKSDVTESPYGVESDKFYNLLKPFTIEYTDLPDTDIAAIHTMMETVGVKQAGDYKPVYYNDNPATPSDFVMAKIRGLSGKDTFVNRNDVTFTLRPVARSL